MSDCAVRVRVRDLHKSFDDRIVLDGIDLDLRAGENLVLIGGSASGKTVLLKCIVGLLRPDSGSVQFDGGETTTLDDGERASLMSRIGVLFQQSALFDSLTVWENVAFGLIRGRGVARTRAKEIAIERLARVGLDAAVAELLPGALSGGMQKRVALARALAADPDFLFLDDPVGGLDPITTTGIDRLITGSIRGTRIAALTITYDVDSIRRIADRVAFLHDGRIAWTGGVTQLETSGNAQVERFVRSRSSAPRQDSLQPGGADGHAPAT
jgi:phospholipid/cholesterol/gamma-HCH transport system ATP-binding protein